MSRQYLLAGDPSHGHHHLLLLPAVPEGYHQLGEDPPALQSVMVVLDEEWDKDRAILRDTLYLNVNHACNWLDAAVTGDKFSVSKIKVNSAIWRTFLEYFNCSSRHCTETPKLGFKMWRVSSFSFMLVYTSIRTWILSKISKLLSFYLFWRPSSAASLIEVA